MTEIFNNISQDVKDLAEFTWGLAFRLRNAAEAAEFLHNVTEYYRHIYSPEEMEFLQFYFRMKMEMMKE